LIKRRTCGTSLQMQQIMIESDKKNTTSSKIGILTSIFLILIITFIAFYPSLRNDFTNWDDNMYVTHNELIRDLSWQNIQKIFTSFYYTLYLPLTMLSYTLEYHFFGLAPSAYHITNLIIHLLNCLLVFWLIFLITGRNPTAFITGILFAIHPLHVESVAWVSERKDVLSTFFFLGTLIFYIYYIKKENLKFYYVSIFIYILSLMSKPMGITLPFVLFLLDYILDKKINRQSFPKKIPFLILAVIFLLLNFIALSSDRIIENKGIFSFLTSLCIACHGFLFYTWKLLLPLKQSSLYPYPEGGKLPPLFFISPFIVCAISLLIIFSRKYTKKILFAGLFFLITILPVSQIIPVPPGIAADRYTYIPSIGLFYLAGEGFYLLYYKKLKSTVLKVILSIILITIITILSVLTWHRCHVWKNSITLWTDVSRNYPYLLLPYFKLGHAYGLQGDYELAIEFYNKVVENEPEDEEAYYNRGSIYVIMEEYDKALEDFNKAIEFKPDYLEARYNRGNLYYKREEYDKALEDYNEAIKTGTDNPQIYYGRGLTHSKRGEYHKAIKDYTKALTLDPFHFEACRNRGNIYYEKALYREAIEDFNLALTINPQDFLTYNSRGKAFYSAGEQKKAINDFSRAIELNPDFPEAYQNRAFIYFMQGDYRKALEDIENMKDRGYEINQEFLKEVEEALEGKE